MNPEDMNDDELCEAVAREVLECKVSSSGVWLLYAKDPADEPKGLLTKIFILSPDGREAIEGEVKRRKWGYLSTSDPGWEKTKSNVTVPTKHEDDSAYGPTTTFKFYSAVDKNKYRSIAIAALKAVRGEGYGSY